jgi:hypothetical protein
LRLLKIPSRLSDGKISSDTVDSIPNHELGTSTAQELLIARQSDPVVDRRMYEKR